MKETLKNKGYKVYVLFGHFSDTMKFKRMIAEEKEVQKKNFYGRLWKAYLVSIIAFAILLIFAVLAFSIHII